MLWTLRKNKITFITAFHLFVILATYLTFLKAGVIQQIPNNDNLLIYDSYWYSTIVEEGYTYQPGVGNNMAFFPLFPLLWKYTGLTAIGICILNYIIFLGSFIFLLKDEKLQHNLLLMLLSFPSFIFFGLVYSEALFFLFTTFIIIGYKKNKNFLLYIGLFGASMTRSICMLFIPTIIICELLNVTPILSKEHRLQQLIYKLSASIGGFLLASAYMAGNTGKWFYFIEIQKYWYRTWNVPKFP
jgi:hypothetical protein